MSAAKKPSKASKSVIVTNRPLLKDSVEDDDAGTKIEVETTAKKTIAHTADTIKPSQPTEELKIPAGPAAKPEPADEPADEEIDEKPEEELTEEAASNKTAPKETPKEVPAEADDAKEPGQEEVQVQESTLKEDKQQAQHDAAVEQLVNSRKYELPINAVEKRKTMHFVVLGIFLSVLLVLIWVDIALDAGLIKINGVSPVTHFFSN